jgi:hypothetical protein
VKVETNIPQGAKFTLEIPVEVLQMEDYKDFTNIETQH